MTMVAGKTNNKEAQDFEADIPVDRIQSQTRCDNDIIFF